VRTRPRRKGPQKRPRELSFEKLERYALWYMERYPGTSARVRRALERRVQRVDPENEDAPAWIDRVLLRLSELRLIDDSRLAAARVRSLRAKGKSLRAIRADLKRQGIGETQISAALGESEPADELEAARRFVRKRRLGRDRERRQKDLAALGRAGFDYETARRALDDA
jgi:regulatory protein